MSGTLLVLDNLSSDIDVEIQVAARLGWEVIRWDGSDATLARAEAVVHTTTRVDAALQNRMRACNVIGRYGTGLDSVDLAAAAVRNISVVRVRDYCTPELASHTLALAFALDRHLGQYDLDWTWEDTARNLPLPGRRRATIVGFGTIGEAVARALAALGIEVRVVTRHNADRATSFAITPLLEGLADADYVFLHAALTTETVGMIGTSEITEMSQNAILINTARIGLIDDVAVADALMGNRIAGVGLDARLPATSPLRQLLGDKRLIVTPHIGWYSERSANELRRRAVENTITEAIRLRGNKGATHG